MTNLDVSQTFFYSHLNFYRLQLRGLLLRERLSFPYNCSLTDVFVTFCRVSVSQQGSRETCCSVMLLTVHFDVGIVAV